ncbi:MAG: hypothetical protein HY534_00765 [Chloroflexi bacterium]|nr:hypothetical protein [Chloroflexota bacterium]
MAGQQRGKVLTSLAGEYLVAGQLCLRGYVASLTLRNYPGVDVFALNPKTNKQVAVQVKTIRSSLSQAKGQPAEPQGSYFLPEVVPDHPFVFVALHPNMAVDFYVVPGEQVRSLSECERQQYLEGARSKGRVPNDVQPRMLNLKAIEVFKDRWDNLGLSGGVSFTPVAPSAD